MKIEKYLSGVVALALVATTPGAGAYNAFAATIVQSAPAGMSGVSASMAAGAAAVSPLHLSVGSPLSVLGASALTAPSMTPSAVSAAPALAGVTVAPSAAVSAAPAVAGVVPAAAAMPAVRTAATSALAAPSNKGIVAPEAPAESLVQDGTVRFDQSSRIAGDAFVEPTLGKDGGVHTLPATSGVKSSKSGTAVPTPRWRMAATNIADYIGVPTSYLMYTGLALAAATLVGTAYFGLMVYPLISLVNVPAILATVVAAGAAVAAYVSSVGGDALTTGGKALAQIAPHTGIYSWLVYGHAFVGQTLGPVLTYISGPIHQFASSITDLASHLWVNVNIKAILDLVPLKGWGAGAIAVATARYSDMVLKNVQSVREKTGSGFVALLAGAGTAVFIAPVRLMMDIINSLPDIFGKIINGIKRAARFTYNHLLTPAGHVSRGIIAGEIALAAAALIAPFVSLGLAVPLFAVGATVLLIKGSINNDQTGIGKWITPIALGIGLIFAASGLVALAPHLVAAAIPFWRALATVAGVVGFGEAAYYAWRDGFIKSFQNAKDWKVVDWSYGNLMKAMNYFKAAVSSKNAAAKK